MSDAQLPALARNIRRLREAKGFKSRRDFAEQIGLDYNMISGWEGKNAPAIELPNLIKLALFFGVRIDDVITGFSAAYDSLVTTIDAAENEKWREHARDLIRQAHGKKSPTEELVRKVGQNAPASTRDLQRELAARDQTIAILSETIANIRALAQLPDSDTPPETGTDRRPEPRRPTRGR